MVNLIKLAASCALFVLVLAGCTAATPGINQGEGSPQDKTSDMQPQRGGTFRLMQGEHVSYGTSDTHRASVGLTIQFTGQSVNQVVKRNIISGNYEIMPELAEGWEAAPDGLSYTFKLRKGVKFHNVPPVNGREFTSDDVEYMIKRISADPSIVPEKWTQLFQRRTDFASIASIEKPDKYTVVVKMKERDAVFMHNMATTGTMVIPRELIDENPDKLIQERIVGTGPFVQKEYVPAVRHILERNPDYWKKDESGTQLPYFDRMEKNYYAGGDTASAVAAFLSGQIDSIGGGQDTETIMKQMGDKAYLLSSPSSSFTVLRINTKRAPFDNVKMRRAVYLAVDRQQIIDSTTGGTATLSGFVPPALKDAGAQSIEEIKDTPGYRYPKEPDIAEAKKLVKEAGFEGVSVDLNTSFATATLADQAALIKEQLDKIGIKVNIKLTANFQDHLNEMLADKFQLTVTGFGASPDPDEFIYKHYHTKGDRNYYKFSDPKWDQLAERQRVATNAEERKKVIREALAYYTEVIPNVMLYASLNQNI